MAEIWQPQQCTDYEEDDFEEEEEEEEEEDDEWILAVVVILILLVYYELLQNQLQLNDESTVCLPKGKLTYFIFFFMKYLLAYIQSCACKMYAGDGLIFVF